MNMTKQGKANITYEGSQISIVLVDKDFLVIDKPQGLASAPLVENDIHNAFSQIAQKYPSVKDVRGRKLLEGGLIHRIDTATRGLLLIACTQTAYDNFQCQQKDGQFVKYYTAICADNRSEQEKSKQSFPFSIVSRFRPFGKGRMQVETVFEGAGRAALKKAGEKLYSTDILSIETFPCKTIAENVQTVKVLCHISEGYRHQVRVHLASAHLPVVGDLLYGTQIAGDQSATRNVGQGMLFFASGLAFNHPTTGERVFVEIPLALL